MTNDSEKDPSAQPLSTTWFAVFVAEFIVIFVLNAFTVIVFASNHKIRKRTTYLIINLTVADLLVGAVSGPLHIYHTVEFELASGFSWGKFIVLTFDNMFSSSSLANLALISLERLHATIFPFRHCLVEGSVYLKAILCIWQLGLIYACTISFFDLAVPVSNWYVWASFVVVTLLTLIVSYAIIIIKVKSNPPRQPFSAAASERKLSITLFMVTVFSVLTIFPWFVYAVLQLDKPNIFSKSTEYVITNSVNVLYYASSLVNPLIYAIRMQEIRKGVKALFCKESRFPGQVETMELPPM